MQPTARGALTSCVLALGGCGLVLQAGPPRPDAATSTLDARASMDATPDARDARETSDAEEDLDASRNLEMDATLPPIDAARPDAALARLDAAIDAHPTSFIDAVAVPRDAPDADARDADAGDAPDADARDAPDGDARDAPDAVSMDAATLDARADARAIDAFCTSTGACDLLTQCGCPAAQACQFGPPPTFSPVCIPPGSVARGGFCMTEAECGRGLTCSYLGDPPGICTSFCVPGSVCAGGAFCLPLGPLSDPLPVGACSANCNPTAAGSCAGGLVCDVANVPGSLSYCRVGGSTAVGRACAGPRDCGARASCVGSVCRALCTTSVPCASGTCTSFTPAVTVAGLSIGYCAD